MKREPKLAVHVPDEVRIRAWTNTLAELSAAGDHRATKKLEWWLKQFPDEREYLNGKAA